MKEDEQNDLINELYNKSINHENLDSVEGEAFRMNSFRPNPIPGSPSFTRKTPDDININNFNLNSNEINNNPNNVNPKNRITNSISFDNYYVNQNKNRNKTTIPNIKDISAYKSKIIKTNSLEQGDTSKISVNISTINDEQNKSYITMSGYNFNKKNKKDYNIKK